MSLRRLRYSAYTSSCRAVYMPVFGMNNGIVPIIAYNYGGRKAEAYNGYAEARCYLLSCDNDSRLLLFQLIPVQLLGMFAPTDDMIRLGETALRIFSVSFVFAGVSIVLSSGLRRSETALQYDSIYSKAYCADTAFCLAVRHYRRG